MKKEKIDQGVLMNILDVLYEKAINGIPGVESATELANDYVLKESSVEKAIDSLIRWQIAKCATSGFLSGLGGLITLPVAIPANLAATYYVQIRMVVAIAHIRGFDIKSDQVKTFVYVCLLGDAAKEVLQEVGIKLGMKLGEKIIEKIGGEVVKAINKKVGFRLVTMFGQKGIINFGRMIPILGGMISASFDASYCKGVASVAKKLFHR